MAVVGQRSERSKKMNQAREELRVTGNFGLRTHPVTGVELDWHTGTDYGINNRSPLTPYFEGVVTGAHNRNSGYGGTVAIYNSVLDLTYLASHMRVVGVSVGDSVSADSVIGLSGGIPGDVNAGSTTGAHLHATLVKGRVSDVPSKDDKSVFINIETYDIESGEGGGGIDPTTPKQITVDIGHMDIGGHMKKNDVYKVASVNGKSVTMDLIKEEVEKPKVNEWGQAVFVGSDIEFSVLYNKANGGTSSVPYFKNSKGRGYGKVKKLRSGASAPYEVTRNGVTIGFVKPVNTY